MWLFSLYLLLLVFSYWVPRSLAVLRWLACAGALWVLTCAVGFLVPLWVILPGSLLIGIADQMSVKYLVRRFRVMLGAGVQLVLLAGYASISIDQPPTWLQFTLWAGHGCLALLLASPVAEYHPRQKRTVIYALTGFGMIGVSVLGLSWDRTTKALGRIQVQTIPFASLRAVSTPTLRQLPLEPGSAWHSAVEPAEKHQCALVLHGADPNGARQAASQSLIVALHELDSYVVAVDHPGYGKSPVPAGRTVQEWDPGELTHAALSHLKRSQCEKITVFGHSMGASEALRLAASANAHSVESIKLLGAGVFEGTQESDAYWYKRFHKDRGLKANTVSFDLWQQIKQAYYHNAHLAEALPAQNRAPIEFYVYDQENPDLAITREILWQILDKPPRINLPMSHYFNAVSFGPVLLLDSRAISKAKQSLARTSEFGTLIAGNHAAVAEGVSDSITRARQ